MKAVVMRLHDSAWNSWRDYDESIISTTPTGTWKPLALFRDGKLNLKALYE
jgi:hypothetical protein